MFLNCSGNAPYINCKILPPLPYFQLLRSYQQSIWCFMLSQNIARLLSVKNLLKFHHRHLTDYFKNEKSLNLISFVLKSLQNYIISQKIAKDIWITDFVTLKLRYTFSQCVLLNNWFVFR